MPSAAVVFTILVVDVRRGDVRFCMAAVAWLTPAVTVLAVVLIPEAIVELRPLRPAVNGIGTNVGMAVTEFKLLTG